MQQTEKYWNLINRIVLGAIVIMAGVGVTLMFAPKVRQFKEYQERAASKQRQIDLTNAAENEYKEKSRRFLNEAEYVEKVAHEVGYARPDETIFQFPEETGAR